MQIWIWIPLLGYVDQDYHMVVMPVHTLHFILNLKTIILNKVNQ